MTIPLHVLMVEDSEDDAVLVIRELRRSGYEPVFKRVDTPEAMRAALARNRWDIVIADYSMPRFSGLSALALVQQSNLDLPFIVVSGNIGEEVAVAAMRAGAHDYVMKDNLARLGAAVSRELDEAKVRRARKDAEESLRVSEERYRTLVETSPDAIILAGLDGRLLTANQQAARLLAVEGADQLIGQSFFGLVAPADRPRAQATVKRLKRDKIARNVELAFQKRDGTTFPAELSMSVIEEGASARAGLIAVVRDSTERKAAEEALRRSYRELTTLYEAARVISSDLALDVVLQSVAEQLTRALDSSGCTLSLWDPEAGRVETLVDHMAFAVSEIEPAGSIYELDEYPATLSVLETRQPAVIQRDDVTADPAERRLMERYGIQTLLMLPLIARDHVLGLVELYNEVKVAQFSPDTVQLAQSLAAQAAVAIENAQLYQETRRQAGRLAALLEISHEISATLNLSAVLERIASHARDLLEADDSEVYLIEPDGQTLRAIVALGDYAAEIKAARFRIGEGVVGAVAQTGQAEVINAVEEDNRGIHIPGTPHETHALLCAPLTLRDLVVGVMALARVRGRGPFSQADLDFVTNLARQAAVAIENARMYAAEHQRTEELARALEQQRELDRLKDEFMQNVSHELRTPVTIIQGYADLLDSGDMGAVPAEQQQPIAIIARRAAGLRKLIDDLTTVLQTRAREFRREPVDLAQVAQQVLADYRLTAEQAELTLVSSAEPDLPTVRGDQDHLRRVLDNLVSNAIKFTPSGGRVTVQLEVARPADRPEAGSQALILSVADTGVGIPSDQLERVFDRFYQVDGSMTRRYGGTGLGLALVKEIVEAHGGVVEIESQVGVGSLFRVILPLAS